MTVQTRYGAIQGVDMGDYIEYRGVPYAKPPVGELRWCPPVEMDPWEGVFQADAFGNRCIDLPHDDPLFTREFYSDPAFYREKSEDCLFISIWILKGLKEGDKLPVAFWIHGGAFLGGFNSELEFDGAAYCRRGVILVSVE